MGRRCAVRQHVMAGVTTVLLAFLGVVSWVLDRQPPIAINEIKLAPTMPFSGDQIVVQKDVEWKRRCRGVAYRSITTADKEVRVYIRETLEPPADLDRPGTHVTRVSLSHGVTSGKATYRSSIVFYDCGLTTRWWPIVVNGPEVEIQVQDP